jgi:pSer/pThr/pTyr-binding forkhead associated (FHA) protein/biotin carboxyl carrier protein
MTPSSGEEQTKAVAGHTIESAELRVVRGAFKGMSCPLSAGTVFIGRSSECDLPLKGAQGVSRRHCKVQYLGNRFVIIDLESRNGTIVNGQSVERKILEKGDRIELGDEVIEFVVESLNDLRGVQLEDGGIEDAPTALLPQSSATPPTTRPAHRPPADDFDAPTRGVERPRHEPRRDPEPLPETLPPRAANAPTADLIDNDLPPPLPPGVLPPPELSSPYVHQPPPQKSRAPLLFAGLAVLVLGGAAFLARALLGGGDAGPEVTTTTTTTTTPAPAPVAEPPPAPAPIVETPPPPPAPVVETPPPDAPPGPPPAPAPVETPPPPAPVVETPPPPPAPVAEAPPVVVRARVAGRARSIEVKAGDRVEAGAVLVVVTGDGGNLGRKLEALRREEREFADAARKDPAAKADLEAVRADIKKLEAKLKPQPIVADSAGTVVEVLVTVGGVVRDGAPVVTLRP